MAEVAIKRVSIKHESIMNFIMENPTVPLGEVANHFQVSQAWLSVIIHSPAFQDKLLEKQGVLFHHTVVATITDKVSMIAHKTLDKLADKIEFMESTKELRETADMAMSNLGYGGGGKNNGAVNGGPTVINNQQIFVGREVYEAAQSRIGLARLEVPERSPAIEGKLDQAPALSDRAFSDARGEGGLPISGSLYQENGE
jgi:hypothetical protein